MYFAVLEREMEILCYRIGPPAGSRRENHNPTKDSMKSYLLACWLRVRWLLNLNILFYKISAPVESVWGGNE